MPLAEDSTMNSHLEVPVNSPNGDTVKLAGYYEHEADASRKRASVVEWLTSILPHLNMPSEATEEELQVTFVFSGSLQSQDGSDLSSEQHLENVKKFLSVLDEMGLPRFKASDLEQGSMRVVVNCLLQLKDHFSSDQDTNSPGKFGARKRWKFSEVETLEGTNGFRGDQSANGQRPLSPREDGQKSYFNSKFQHVLRGPVMSEPSSTLLHHVGHKFHEFFQLKQGQYSDLPAAMISEMMKSNSIDNAPTQSLLSVVNGILDESIERKNGEIPHNVACLLRKVVQEIEHRISTQAEHIRNQNNLIKAREEKYQSRIRVLETLATGTSDETQIIMNQLQRMKTEKNKIEEIKKLGEQDAVKLMKEKENSDLEASKLKNEIEIMKKAYEEHCLQLQKQDMEAKVKLEERLKEVENLLTESRKKAKELEAFSESKVQSWNSKENQFWKLVAFQFEALQGLKVTSRCIKKEILDEERSWLQELNSMGEQLKGLADVAQNYHTVLAENRKLYNEVQDLKGNIQVYCRIRPFLPGQARKQTTIDYIGENGELLVVNSFKPGKDGHRMFKFNKVFGPSATQEEVFVDTQPLIRSVLDGYNVCIFAYGQTGSGKTYTMTGPNSSLEKDWGVNYRALNDLFYISQSRRSIYIYEVGVQMVEVYNEQVRDLLTTDGAQNRLGIWSTAQPYGLAVPNASMRAVKSTSDVLELMQIGLMNCAVGATALNERSSRSHSILTVHIRGSDLETGAVLHGSLHLVDLAGSERVARSEATGNRLREAQHINKSLSALGDVISALAQKSSHIPYRNSKLTQVLQSSLGGIA